MFGTRKADQASVARAFMMAVGLPAPFTRALRVTVRSLDGVLLGEGILNGPEQVDFLRDQLEIVSSFDILRNPAGRHRTWDVMFQERASASDAQPMPDRWPAAGRGSRAGVKT